MGPLLNRLRRACRRPAAAVALVSLLSLPSFGQTPCADVGSLLEMLRLPAGRTSTLFTGGWAAFYPKDAEYDGSALSREDLRCTLVLRKEGAELERWTMLLQGAQAVYSRFQPYGAPASHNFDSAGNYELAFELDGKPVTRVPFTVALSASGDPFNPATSVAIDTELMHWAQLRSEVDHPTPTMELGFWLRKSDLDLKPGEDVQITFERAGQPVYRCREIRASNLPSGPEWRNYNASILFPEAKGGRSVFQKDFLKLDGDYRVVFRAGDRILRAFQYTIQNGQAVPHARSEFGYEPAVDYLLPRTLDGDGSAQISVQWLEPLADPTVGAAAPAAVVKASASTRAAWKPSVPAPARPTALTVTNVAARVDAHLAAGDGIIAYGTGAVRGVAYLDCATGEEKSIPGGAEYASGAFLVCGKKIVLVKGRQVSVFDTATGQMTAIPLEDVHLAKTPSSMTKGRAIDADGMLVAVLCDPTKTTDRRSVKVLDLAGPTPKIIGMGFPDAPASHLCSIAVDAAGGVVVVGSDRQAKLFAADIAEDAPFKAIDLSGYDGLPRDCAPIVRKGSALIFDSTGTRKLRRVDLATGAVRTIAPLAKAEQWFAFDGERVALAGSTSHGGTYEVLVGSAASGAPAPPAGGGGSAGSGKLGYGQRVAMTEGGLVFASGIGKGGIGSGENLYVAGPGGWTMATVDGEPLKAVDATLGQHVLAFKTGKSRDARIGFVLLGKSSKPADLAR